MTGWNGRGLPPVAAARIERFSSSGLRTSLLSVPASVSLDSVGFEPVGEVLGCIVEQISWTGYGGCGLGAWGAGGWGMAGGWGGPQAFTVLSSGSSRYFGYGPYVQAVEHGFGTALRRMLDEATALGADGVVGVRLTETHLDHARGTREFIALGTAVRARTQVRPHRPFTTDLPGTDVAKLLSRGWCPVELQVAIEVALRHDDWRTQTQAGQFFQGNVEVSGYTELVQQTRQLARGKLQKALARAGADGGVVSDMRLRIWEIEPSDNHRDHVAEATILGTAIAAFDRRRIASSDASRPLTFMPMKSKAGT